MSPQGNRGGELISATRAASERYRGVPPSRPSVESPPQADVLTLLSIFLRRWYIIVPGLALATIAAYFVYQSAVPEYLTEGTLLLTTTSDGAVSASSEEDAEDQDDLTSVDGLALSGRAIAEVTQGDGVRLELIEQGLEANYTVQFEEAGSLFRVEAISTNESEVVPTAEAAMEAIRTELADRQEAAGVQPEERVDVDVLAQPALAVPTEVETPTGEFVTEYTASGVLAMISTPGEEGQPNPYGANRATAQLIEGVMTSDAMSRRITNEQEGVGYDVGQNRQDAAPFLYIEAWAPGSSELALQTYGAVRAVLEEELNARQQDAGADPESFVTVQTVSEPDEALEQEGDGLRTALTIFALIAALAFGSTLVLESVTNALARRREAETRLPMLYSESSSDATDLERRP